MMRTQEDFNHFTAEAPRNTRNRRQKGVDILGAIMMTESNIQRVPDLIARLYQVVRELEELFQGRPFTPDGHLVGSIGEVVAAHIYDLELERCSNSGFDAKTQFRKSVEIKLTGGDSVSLSSDCNPTPEFLIVLKLNSKTGFTEIYNGEFPLELWQRKRPSKRKVVSLRLKELKDRKRDQPLKQKNSLDEFNRLFSLERS
jgi:hypothetical protein